MSDINEVKYGAGSSAKRTAAAKVFKNIYKDVKTRRNSDYSKIFIAVQQGANAPGKLPLDPAAMEIVPWVEDVTVEIEGDGTAFLFSDSDILDVAYDVAEQLLDALRKDGLIPLKGMREGKSFRSFRKQLDEQTYALREGAVKAAMEDWIESLPKAVVDEINKKYADKLKKAELTGLSKGDPVRKALIDLLNKHKVPPALGDKSREMDISALELMFVTMLGEAFNPGDYGFRIDKDGDKFVVYKLSTSQGSVRFPDGRRGTVINRYKTMEEAIAAVKRNAGVKEAAPAKKADDEVEEATDTAPSESDLKIWYKATGAVPPFEGAVPSYKLLKKMFLRDKKQENKAWKIWQDLVKKGKVSESVEVDEAMVKVALNPNKKIGYQVTDVGPGGKRTVSKSENFPEEEAIIQVREAGHQTLYRYMGKYYIVSYSSLANETMIFAGDAKGKPTSYADLWSDRGGVHPDAAIKEFLSRKFKKDLQVKIGQ